VIPPAIRSALGHDLPVAVILAQAILESAGRVNGEWAWGGSRLYRFASNPFGIKISHQLKLEGYQEFSVETHEIEHGKLQEAWATFVKFPTLEAAFAVHARLFTELETYRPALEARHDWRAFARAIMNCGYSTDRPELCRIEGCAHYAGKLEKLVEIYRLDDWKALAGYQAGIAPPVSSQPPAVSGQAPAAGAPLKAESRDLKGEGLC